MESLDYQGFYNDSITIENNTLNNAMQLLSSIKGTVLNMGYTWQELV